jgi:predicted  nucleic acid-binding Zn-ribbon protein
MESGITEEIEKLKKRYLELSNELIEDNKELVGSLTKRYRRNIIVPIRDGYCQGCFIAITPEIISVLKSGERVVTCLNCGRILIAETEE